MEIDIVVGVSTKDCEKTISNIVQVVDLALSKYFSKYNSYILGCDGFSKDNTKKAFMNTKTKTDKKIISEKGKRSKGNAFKTIVEKVKPNNFKVLLILNGDMEGINELWVKRLISEVLNKKSDVALASYKLDKNDSLICDHLVGPLVKALFNTNLRDPMTGDYCLSRKVCLDLIGNTYFPLDSSIDLFVNVISLCEKYKITEYKFGPKDHTSSVLYKNPEDLLIPRFNQVAKELIHLIRYYRSGILKETKYIVNKKGSFEKTNPKSIDIDLNIYKDFSRNYIFNEMEYVLEIYNHLNKQCVIGLKTAWLNWLCIYFEKTSKMSYDEVEKFRKNLTNIFIDNKHLLKL